MDGDLLVANPNHRRGMWDSVEVESEEHDSEDPGDDGV